MAALIPMAKFRIVYAGSVSGPLWLVFSPVGNRAPVPFIYIFVYIVILRYVAQWATTGPGKARNPSQGTAGSWRFCPFFIRPISSPIPKSPLSPTFPPTCLPGSTVVPFDPIPFKRTFPCSRSYFNSLVHRSLLSFRLSSVLQINFFVLSEFLSLRFDSVRSHAKVSTKVNFSFLKEVQAQNFHHVPLLNTTSPIQQRQAFLKQQHLYSNARSFGSAGSSGKHQLRNCGVLVHSLLSDPPRLHPARQ